MWISSPAKPILRWSKAIRSPTVKRWCAYTNRVELTPDYAHAKVYFTVLVGDPQETEEALNHAAGHLRNLLFKRLHIHTVPSLHFVYDRTLERAADMDALIAKAVASRSKNEDEA